MARLGDVCFKITDGSHNPPQGVSASEYLMLSSKNIFDDVITFDDPRYLSKEDFELENKRTQIATGDILMTIVGTVGRAAVVPDLAHNICLQRSVAVLKPKSEIVLPRFLMYQLQSMRTKMEKEAKGVAQKGIYLKQVEDLPIRVLSMDEQTGIVSSLDKVSNLLSFRKQQLAKLDELVKSRFIELFGSPDYNEKGLSTLPMTDLCEIIDGDRGKNYPKQEEFSEEGFCLFLNAKNVTSNGFSFENCMYITVEKDKILRNGKLSRGDVVLTTRGTLGNLAFYDESVPYAHMRINSGMVILRMKRDRITERFFIEQFKMQLASIKERIASGSAQPQLPISTMNKIVMLVPDVELQNQFAAFVEQTDKSKLVVQQSIDQLETLKKSLMQKYFG